MSKNRPIYLSEISAFKSNDNRIAPIESPRPNGKIRKSLFILALASIGLGGLFYVAPLYMDILIERLERQREATENYNCAYYGAAINKHYGRDVCEDESLHRANLETSNH